MSPSLWRFAVHLAGYSFSTNQLSPSLPFGLLNFSSDGSVYLLDLLSELLYNFISKIVCLPSKGGLYQYHYAGDYGATGTLRDAPAEGRVYLTTEVSDEIHSVNPECSHSCSVQFE